MTVDIKLCQSGLTKIVTFCPFFLVSNLSKFDMEVREEGDETWLLVPAEKVGEQRCFTWAILQEVSRTLALTLVRRHLAQAAFDEEVHLCEVRRPDGRVTAVPDHGELRDALSCG